MSAPAEHSAVYESHVKAPEALANVTAGCKLIRAAD